MHELILSAAKLSEAWNELPNKNTIPTLLVKSENGNRVAKAESDASAEGMQNVEVSFRKAEGNGETQNVEAYNDGA